MNVREANRVRACLDCGAPGALLWRTTCGENPGRLLRICQACLRKEDWHRFGLVEREPILDEVAALPIMDTTQDGRVPRPTAECVVGASLGLGAIDERRTKEVER